MSEKKRFVQVELLGGSKYVEPIMEFPSMLEADVHDADLGDIFTIEIIEMTQEEYESLPEFEGH
jgi:hypothetical protein